MRDTDVETDRSGASRARLVALYEAAGSAVYRYALRRVTSVADASDITAEVFAVAWRRIDDVPDAPADRLWLLGVARRVVARQHRSTARRRQLLSRLSSHSPSLSDDTSEPSTLSPELEAALYRLRSRDRETLLLVVWDGLSHAEVGELLGCSANAVAIRVHRAKARLRADLSGSVERPAPPESLLSAPQVQEVQAFIEGSAQ